MMPVRLWIALITCCAFAVVSADERRSATPTTRIPWTTSRVIGSPDPPLPYTVEPAFPHIRWQRPIYAIAEPGTRRIVVVEQGGERDRPSIGRLLVDEDDIESTDTFFEVDGRLVYGLTFHPDYATNRQVFVFTNGPTVERKRFNRISRYTASSDGEGRASTPRLDPRSERVIIEWPSSGHDGGDLIFGNDGLLYATSGDGTTDSDTDVSGQDMSTLRAGVLRIDVDQVDGDSMYSVPDDNPFVGITGARPELWVIGLRNPWRMSIDRQTGQIWVGNNGQDLWETAYLLRRGDNYGWSVYEGRHPFYPGRRLAPVPYVPPTIEHHHREARSLTGGVVYRGDVLPDLDGVYVYGDYSTGKIWGARHDGEKIVWHRELADTTLQIACFAITPRKELLVVDLGGVLYRLRRAPKPADDAAASPSAFPRKLSETGVFASVQEQHPAAGVVAYSIVAPQWLDGASARRFIAIPGTGRMRFSRDRPFGFPEGSVLVQTVTLAERRIETRILAFWQNEWSGYSYVWDEPGVDAKLAPAVGMDIEVAGHGSWHVPSRAECMSCHSRAAGYVLGVTGRQLNRDIESPASTERRADGEVAKTEARVRSHSGQLEYLARNGLLENPPRNDFEALPDPRDTTRDLESRARAYLHVNCSPCHVEAGGGNAQMELRFERSLDDTGLVDCRPRHATFGLPNAMIVAPGEPRRSVLLERLRRTGSGQMPPLGRSRVDENAVKLFEAWIASLARRREFVHHWKIDDLAPKLAALESEGRSMDSGNRAFRAAGCQQCHRFRGEGGGIGPDLSAALATTPDKGRDSAPGKPLTKVELLEAILEPSKKIAPEFATTVILTKDGMVLQGRIEREDAATIVLRTSDVFAKPVEIRKDDLVHRSLSETSTMPEGILDTFREEEILDLLAYLRAGGGASRD